MGKGTFKEFVPKDDPMFSSGPELFSRLGSRMSSATSATGTGGATREASTSAKSQQKTLPDLQNLPEDPALVAMREMDRALSGSTTGKRKD